MFNVTESQMAFLGIRIISVLTITAVLITIEYRDHLLQKKIAQLSGKDEKIKALTKDQIELVKERKLILENHFFCVIIKSKK